MPEGLVVWRDDPEDSDSEKLAFRLGVPLRTQEEPPEAAWLLFFDEGALYLQANRFPDFLPFCVDFLDKEFIRRCRSASKNDVLLKAIGVKKGVHTVCDATCGLGYDAYFLASFRELEVTACERSPIPAELVMDALLRVKDAADMGKSRFLPFFYMFGDGRELLRHQQFDAVYLDPMYPRDEKASAKPRKEMVLFRELVGNDLDAEELFELAWAAAKKRVVVKRSDNAPLITETRQPDFAIEGKTVRFDVYLKNP